MGEAVGLPPLPPQVVLPLLSVVQVGLGVAPPLQVRLPLLSYVQVGLGLGLFPFPFPLPFPVPLPLFCGQLLPVMFFLWPFTMQLTVGFGLVIGPIRFHVWPVKAGSVEKSVGVGENSASAKVFQIFAGQ